MHALRTIGSELLFTLIFANLASAHLALAQVDEGLAAVDDGLKCVERTGERWAEAELYPDSRAASARARIAGGQRSVENCFTPGAGNRASAAGQVVRVACCDRSCTALAATGQGRGSPGSADGGHRRVARGSADGRPGCCETIAGWEVNGGRNSLRSYGPAAAISAGAPGSRFHGRVRIASKPPPS